MTYKITNPSNIPSKFRDRNGRMHVLGAKESITLDVLPENPKGWIIGTKTGKSDRDELIALKGIEDELADSLLRVYNNIETIKSKSAEEIADKISGIGLKRAEKLLEQLDKKK